MIRQKTKKRTETLKDYVGKERRISFYREGQARPVAFGIGSLDLRQNPDDGKGGEPSVFYAVFGSKEIQIDGYNARPVPKISSSDRPEIRVNIVQGSEIEKQLKDHGFIE